MLRMDILITEDVLRRIGVCHDSLPVDLNYDDDDDELYFVTVEQGDNRSLPKKTNAKVASSHVRTEKYISLYTRIETQ